MKKNNIHRLLHKLAQNKANKLEHEAFISWVDTLDEEEYLEVLNQYQQILLQYPETGKPLPEVEKRIERQLDLLPTSTYSVPLKKWWDIAKVASVLLVATVGTWYALSILDDAGSNSAPTEKLSSRYGDDILPGTDKATLTMSNGQTIILDDIPEGQLNLNGGIHILKTGEGAITYDLMKTSRNKDKPTYHTITTPVGGEYQVTLPDGSKVWLNSMSSITAPDVFDEKQRMVDVTGEVFFDIKEKRTTHGKKIPFLVKTGNQTVAVLGTQFNINAYPENHAVETTLVEGKVKVSSSGTSTVLRPGEQSRVNPNGQMDLLENVNIGKIVAWKNGYFHFSDDSILEIMKQLSRWYGIQPEFVGDLPESGFGGQIGREKNISEVLRVLELTDEVSFNIEGQKVKVWKKNLNE